MQVLGKWVTVEKKKKKKKKKKEATLLGFEEEEEEEEEQGREKRERWRQHCWSSSYSWYPSEERLGLSLTVLINYNLYCYLLAIAGISIFVAYLLKYR